MFTTRLNCFRCIILCAYLWIAPDVTVMLRSVERTIGGFHVTSLPPCWWMKIKDLSLSSFVRPPEVVHFPIVNGVSRGWLKTSYSEKVSGF